MSYCRLEDEFVEMGDGLIQLATITVGYRFQHLSIISPSKVALYSSCWFDLVFACLHQLSLGFPVGFAMTFINSKGSFHCQGGRAGPPAFARPQQA